MDVEHAPAPALVPLPIADGDVRLWRGFMDATAAAAVFARLRRDLAWTQGAVKLFGRTHAIPRLQAWVGDAGCAYAYSGMQLDPAPWSDELAALRARVQAAAAARLNCVLINLYRDGRDGVGWHSDDEHGLGPQPVILSLSLGASRTFQMRHRTRKDVAGVRIELVAGDLLLMAGATQRYWHHQVPKTSRQVGERINLTFRWIEKAAAGGAKR